MTKILFKKQLRNINFKGSECFWETYFEKKNKD